MAVVEYLVLSVEKAARLTPWEHVTDIFCREPDGGIRRMTYYDAIRQAEEGAARFHTVHRGRHVELELAPDAMGNNRLLANLDGKLTDVLVTLPDYRDGAD